jgi:hypothetical protein
MATAHQEKGVIARCIEFFGPLPDQSSEEFAAELKRLPEQDKREPAELFNTADMPTAMPMGPRCEADAVSVGTSQQ